MYQFEEDFSTPEDLAKAKIFFQVVIDYNRDLIKSMVPEEHSVKIDSMGPMESNPLSSYDEADEMAKDTIEKIQSKFPGSSVKQLEPEEQEDEYHLWISNDEGDHIAKVGVIAIDYSEATIH